MDDIRDRFTIKNISVAKNTNQGREALSSTITVTW